MSLKFPETGNYFPRGEAEEELCITSKRRH